MSRFYASIQGNGGEATRQGTPSSGIDAHIRGWDVGIQVYGYVDNKGRDTFRIELTSGSNGDGRTRLLGLFREEDVIRFKDEDKLAKGS